MFVQFHVNWSKNLSQAVIMSIFMKYGKISKMNQKRLKNEKMKKKFLVLKYCLLIAVALGICLYEGNVNAWKFW